MHLELSVIPFYYKTCSKKVEGLIRQFEIKMRLNRELFIFNGGFLYHFKTLDENLKQKKILFNAGDLFFEEHAFFKARIYGNSIYFCFTGPF